MSLDSIENWIEVLAEDPPTPAKEKAGTGARIALAELRAEFAKLQADLTFWKDLAAEIEKTCGEKELEIQRLRTVLAEAKTALEACADGDTESIGLFALGSNLSEDNRRQSIADATRIENRARATAEALGKLLLGK